jgi:hypothetical protein
MMPPANHPRLSLGDVMILVATTGLSLSIYILLDNGLFSGQRFFFGLFKEPSGGLNTLQLISRVGGALSMLLILFGGWTLVLPVLSLRKHRSQWRRLSRQPGISACIAVATGMLGWAAVACTTLWIRDLVEGHSALPPAFWIRSPIFDGLIVCAGTSVAAVWVVQIVTGRWRPNANGFDRFGRCLGVLWFAVAATLAARLLLN